MDTTLYQEEENKKKGLITSVVLHGILLLLCILPLLTFPTPPPGQAGVLVSFGEPDVGQGEEEPGPATSPEVVPEEVSEPEAKEEIAEREVEPEKPKEPKKEETKKVNTDDNSKEIALKKKKEKEKKVKEAAEQKKKDAAAKAKRDAAAKAKAEADAKKKKFDDAKNQIGDLFNNNGQGSGTGSQGTSGTDGNAGNPDGDPDATKLDGIGKGDGDVSGFGNRGFARPGVIKGNFQEIGTVNIKVCVDGNGTVVSATPKLAGSTTQNPKLQSLAIANAKKYKFDKSAAETQCGTITYKFQLQ